MEDIYYTVPEGQPRLWPRFLPFFVFCFLFHAHVCAPEAEEEEEEEEFVCRCL